jgi:hypothetical protein
VEERLRAVIDFVWRPYTTRVHTRARARAHSYTRLPLTISTVRSARSQRPLTSLQSVPSVCVSRITQSLCAVNLSDSMSRRRLHRSILVREVDSRNRDELRRGRPSRV